MISRYIDFIRKYDVVFGLIEELTKESKYFELGYIIPPKEISERVCFHVVCSQSLFAFFVFCVTDELNKIGVDIRKNEKPDLKRFSFYFPTFRDIVVNGKPLKNKPIDRKTLSACMEGYEPKGAKELRELIKKHLQKIKS